MTVKVEGIVGLELTLGPGLVKKHPDPLRVNVESFKYDMGGIRDTFDGAVAQSVTDDDANYIYLSEAGSLVINTTGYPSEVSYLPLAIVTTANGAVVDIADERVFIASSAAVVGTCRIGFPVDGGIIGGNAAVSSNNNIASVTFAASGESRNRWNIRPPQNYTSGNLTFRCYCSLSGSPGSTGMRLGLKWHGLKDGEALPSGGTYDNDSVSTVDVSGESSDVMFYVDISISSSTFDKTDDLLALYFYRDADHAEDDCTLLLHTHICELRYTGYKVAGQAGQ